LKNDETGKRPFWTFWPNFDDFWPNFDDFWQILRFRTRFAHPKIPKVTIFVKKPVFTLYRPSLGKKTGKKHQKKADFDHFLTTFLHIFTHFFEVIFDEKCCEIWPKTVKKRDPTETHKMRF
jgi:hypothetical protein